MEKFVAGNSIEIFFELEKMTLLVIWLPGISCLSKKEYIDNWYTIMEHIDILKPRYLLIETRDFEYKALREISVVFNYITEKIGPKNIALVLCNNMLGRITLDDLIKNCPVEGHKVFNSSNDANNWLESRK